MGVVSTEKKKNDGYAQQELLRRRILVAIVDLLPHVEIIVCSCVELEWYTLNVMEHQVGAEHVGYVCQRPRSLLGHPRNDVVEDLKDNNEYGVNEPST